jgi:hypothetical protein
VCVSEPVAAINRQNIVCVCVSEPVAAINRQNIKMRFFFA